MTEQSEIRSTTCSTDRNGEHNVSTVPDVRAKSSRSESLEPKLQIPRNRTTGPNESDDFPISKRDLPNACSNIPNPTRTRRFEANWNVDPSKYTRSRSPWRIPLDSEPIPGHTMPIPNPSLGNPASRLRFDSGVRPVNKPSSESPAPSRYSPKSARHC